MSEEVKQKKEEKNTKRTIKDSVFSDFFGMPEYLLKLYQTLHLEDQSAGVEDLQDVTIQNVLVDDIYNDLGFRVGNRLLILIEAQSTWSMNIIIRVLIYLATTYQKYINEHELDVYSSTKISIPKPEMYVLYTGNRKTRPEEITLSREFFDGEDLQLEVKVKMLYGTGTVDEFFTGMLHKKLMQLFIRLSGLKGSEKYESVDQGKIDKVFSFCRDFTVTVTAANSFDTAQATAGGVLLSEVTDEFEAKRMPGFYLVGEVLDVDGKCGGYNLHWAWCSGMIAGESASLGRHG